MNRLVLIDGNAILHRAYHALPGLTNKKGEPTNAVYGFVSMLLRVIEDLKPSHLIIAFDRPKPTFRKKLFKDYQAHRPAMEDGLSSQFAKVYDVINAMKIPMYGVDGFEADDLLGTLARRATEKSKIKNQKSKIEEVIIVTGDRDLLQLVNDKVKLYMPVKGMSEAKLFGEKEAEERMGVSPNYIADLKGLMGDPSDNYPGVAGIGPKTAVNLIHEFGTVEEIYKHIKDIKNPSVAEKLKKGKDDAKLSKKLATVVRDVPLKCDLNEAKVPDDFVNQEVIDVFGELGFKTLLKRLLGMIKSEEVGEKKEEVKKEQMELF